MADRATGRLGYRLAAIKPITWLDPDDQGDVRCSGEWASGTDDVAMIPIRLSGLRSTPDLLQR
jgi:hypothetical protein